MKIKYRRYGDTEYTEVKCDSFNFHNNDYITRNELELGWVIDGEIHWEVNVCEVYVEEI